MGPLKGVHIFAEGFNVRIGQRAWQDSTAGSQMRQHAHNKVLNLFFGDIPKPRNLILHGFHKGRDCLVQLAFIDGHGRRARAHQRAADARLHAKLCGHLKGQPLRDQALQI